jgi:RNA polymerase primary sigma factor
MAISRSYPRTYKKRAVELDSFRLYSKEISKFPLLTAEEERELARRARAGDNEAAQKLVEGNLRFVIKMARKFQKSGVPLLDLINEGNTGLIEATQRFDPEKNVRFLTYAVWWIRQAIQHYLSHDGKMIRTSTRTSAIFRKLSQMPELTEMEFGKLRRDSLAEKLGITVEELDRALQFVGNLVSLDAPIDATSELVFGEIIPQELFASAEDIVAAEYNARYLQGLMRVLTAKEVKVLHMRFGLGQEEPMTLQEIGERLGYSRERIRQIEARSLRKLRKISTAEYSNYLS